jgi:hypothetical protein
MTLVVAGLVFDPLSRRLTTERGSVVIDSHIARLFVALMERPEQIVGQDALLEALVGNPSEDLLLHVLLRRALKVVRSVLVTMTGGAVVLTDRDGDRFVLGPRPKTGSPAALRKAPRPKLARLPHVNVSIRPPELRGGPRD